MGTWVMPGNHVLETLPVAEQASYRVLAALPLIADCIEAAERSAERIVQLETMGHAPLLAALAALREHLEGGDVT